MFGLFVGAFQLFVMVNAAVRSIAGKWALGTVGALVRIFLLIAITMASARIRVAGAQPSSAFFVALVLGPALSVVLWLLAVRRQRAMAEGSEERSAAARIATSWLAVAAIDAVFVLVGLAPRFLGTRG